MLHELPGEWEIIFGTIYRNAPHNHREAPHDHREAPHDYREAPYNHRKALLIGAVVYYNSRESRFSADTSNTSDT